MRTTQALSAMIVSVACNGSPGPSGTGTPMPSTSRDYVSDTFPTPRIVGDLNGDGFDDLSWGFGDYRLGGVDGLMDVEDRESVDPGDFYEVTPADFNGDGEHDHVVQSPWRGGTYVNSGTVTITSSARTPNEAPSYVLEWEQANARFGQAIAWGDFDADGFDDLIVGISALRDGQNVRGAVAVYYGSATGLSPSPDQLQTGAALGELLDTIPRYGSRLLAGDFNGDGYADVLLLNVADDATETVLAVQGSAAGLDFAEATLTGVPATLQTDGPVGDANADGRDDFALDGAIYTGTDSPQLVALQPTDRAVVQLLPDANGDGYSELVNADSDFWTSQAVVMGGPDVLMPDAARVVTGYTMTSTGDMNGDGYHDYATTRNVWLGSAEGPRIPNIRDVGYTPSRDFFYDIDRDGLLDERTDTHLVLGSGQSVEVTPEWRAFWLGDSDLDGNQEFAFSRIENSRWYYLLWETSDDEAVDVSDDDLFGVEYASSLFGDYDGDGRLDAITVGVQGLVLNRGDSWEATGFRPEGYGQPLLFADWNGDGKHDLIVDSGIWLGGEVPELAAPDVVLPPLSHPVRRWSAADLDGDGSSDLVASSRVGTFFFDEVVLSSRGEPIESVALTIPIINDLTEEKLLHDINGDGQDDYVVLADDWVYAFTLDVASLTFRPIMDHPLYGEPVVTEQTQYGFRLGDWLFEDRDGDGTWRIDDCDDTDPSIVSYPLFTDEDADGYGAGVIGTTRGIWYCGTAPGWGIGSQDCDDADPTRSPGVHEVCNGVDDDCNGTVDLGVDDAPEQYRDADGDGHAAPDARAVRVCAGTRGWSTSLADCDDTDPRFSPDFYDACDGQDNDCDGVADNQFLSWEAEGTVVSGFLDEDGDGAPGTTRFWACNQATGSLLQSQGTDCDDANPNVYPSADEVCDGIDNDCDGTTDVDIVGQPIQYVDSDGDGFGSDAAPGVALCPDVAGYALNNSDCNDYNPDVYPGAPERCDGADQDCDGSVDEGPYVVGPGTIASGFIDADNDGLAGPVPGGHCLEDDPSALYPASDDCDDSNPTVLGPTTWYRDADGDSFGDSLDTMDSCGDESRDYSLTGGDCDDGQPVTNPDATETCDGQDNDCNGFVDDISPENALASGYPDMDGDGAHGGELLHTCIQNDASLSAVANDCDDSDPQVYPDAPERCDGQDQDCDGSLDEGPYVVGPGIIATGFIDSDDDGLAGPTIGGHCLGEDPAVLYQTSEDCDDSNPTVLGPTTWYRDADGDSFGDSLETLDSCGDERPEYSLTAGDCDDGHAVTNPSATEACDGRDNDCNGLVDDVSPENALASGYPDMDGDGAHGGEQVHSCIANDPSLSAVADDCDDANSDVSPTENEVCNEVDDNCDGVTDGPDAIDALQWFRDADGDGFGQDADAVTACAPPRGYAAQPGDCNDADDAVNPAALEDWYDGVDANCDGNDDDQDGDGITVDHDCDDVDPSNTDICTAGCNSSPGPVSLVWVVPFVLLGVQRRSTRP